MLNETILVSKEGRKEQITSTWLIIKSDDSLPIGKVILSSIEWINVWDLIVYNNYLLKYEDNYIMAKDHVLAIME